MLHTLRGWFQFNIDGGGLRICEVYWDDTADVIRVYSWPDFTNYPDTGFATLHTGGAVIRASDNLPWALNNVQSGYFFCNSGTLNEFFGQPEFPYYNQVFTPNAPSCTITQCDLRIQRPLQTTKSSALDDGTMSVKASTTNGATEFSLDETTYFPGVLVNGFYTYTFTSLSVGTYIVYSQDAGDCKDQTAFTIDPLDEYQNKYTSQFVQNDFTFTVNLKKRGFTGQSQFVNTVDLQYIFGQESDPLWRVIKGSTLEMTFKKGKANTEDTFQDLATQDDRLWLVEILKGTSLEWKGWLLPDKIIDQWKSSPSTYKVSARDGLGALKEFDFVAQDTSEFQGNRTIIEAIDICLSKLELDLDIYSAANIRSLDHSNTQDPLEYSKFPIDSMDGLNCYEVMERLLYHYQIYQSQGRWMIIPFNNVDDLTFTIFTNGVNNGQSAETVSKTFSSLGNSDRRISVLGRGQAFATTEFAFKESIVVQDYGLLDQLIENGSFENWTSGIPDGWVGTGIQSGNVFEAPNRGRASTLTLLGQAGSDISGEYIESTPFFLKGIQGAQLERGRIFGKIKGDFDATVRINLRLHYFGVVGDFYLNDNGLAWLQDPDERLQIQIEKKNSYAEFEIPIQFMASDGVYDFRLYQGASTGNVISLTADYLEIRYEVDNLAPLAETTYTAINQDKTTVLVNDEKVYIGNVPELENSSEIYGSGLLDLNNVPLDEFHRGENVEKISYADIFARNILVSQGQQLLSFSGSIGLFKGAELRPYDVIKLRDVEDVIYKVIFWRQSVPDQTMTIYLTQLTEADVIEPQNPILLYTNGDGILYPDLVNIGLENGSDNVGALAGIGQGDVADDDLIYVVDSLEPDLEFQNKRTDILSVKTYGGGGATPPTGTGVLYNNAGVLDVSGGLVLSAGELIESEARLFGEDLQSFRVRFNTTASTSNQTIDIYEMQTDDMVYIDIFLTCINTQDLTNYETTRLTYNVIEDGGSYITSSTLAYNSQVGDPYTATVSMSGAFVRVSITNNTGEFTAYNLGALITRI